MASAADKVLAVVPVSRGRALIRASLRLGLATILFVLIVLKYLQLDFRPSAVSNRIADYSWACILLAVAIVALIITATGARWLLLAAWPGRLAIVGTRGALSLRLGPMGQTSYDAPRLVVRYLFELPEPPDDSSYEALLDEREQMASFLPQIMHPSTRERLDRTILRFASAPEPDVAARLRPFIDYCRTLHPAATVSDAPPPASTQPHAPVESTPPDGGKPTFKIPRSYRDRIARRRGETPEKPPQPPAQPDDE